MLATAFGASIRNLIYCSTDLCALVLSFIVLINFALSKKISNKSNRLFMLLTCLTLASTVIHIAAIVSISVIYAPVWVCNILTMLNYAAYNSIGVVFVVYTVWIIYENLRVPRACKAFAYALTILSAAAAIFAAVCLFMYGYSNVPAALKYGYEGLVYGLQFIALAFAATITVIQRKRLSTISQLNIYLFSALNIVAIGLQFFLRVQVSNFALAVALIVIYITLQRPEDAIDAVSGAFNVGMFIRRGNTGADEKFYVFAIELNNMTVVNSSFGIHGGNQVISEVANRLKAPLKKWQHLYRLSGVRFAIIFNTREEYEEYAAQYTKILERPVSVNQTELRITAIACVIAFPEVTDKLSEVEDLLRYYRKSINASDDIIVADADALEKARRHELVDYAIQNAINNRSFEVYYQPIYCVNEKSFCGCEALIRLRDEKLGFISPDEFIPIAEQNGKIIEVGRFVIEEVCRFIKQAKPDKLGISFVDVNLSVIQCMHPEIINDIEDTLKKYGVPRSMVNLEITETASAKSYAMLQSKLNELHSNGFTISLDDFGTGFASVEYLINFPFDVVKLDKSLVWAYMSTKKYEPILQHYMPMLHSLGTRIVAEGVETKQMVDALVGLGCDYLQGYYFSRPVPKEQFIEFIKNNSDTKTA